MQPIRLRELGRGPGQGHWAYGPRLARSAKVAFISPCGWGNLGDAAIQESFIANVRARVGRDAEIIGITQNPPDTARRHGVRAFPMEARSPWALSDAGTGAERLSRGKDCIARVRRRGQAVRPLEIVLRRVWRLRREVAHWRLAWSAMRGCRLLAVSGGGQFDDYWGGPWSVPYALWKWTLTARLRRVPVVVLSIGTGSITTTMTQRFLRAVLRRAAYTSCRDPRSAEVLEEILGDATRARLVPDLAFGHHANTFAVDGTAASARRICLSPIGFLDPETWPVKDRAAHDRYVDRFCELTRLLTTRGHNVVICVTDSPDLRSARLIYDRVKDGLGRVEFVETSTTDDLLACFRSAHVVVASRLHGVILANICRVPTVAISYDWKVDEHAKSVGLGDWVVPIDGFSPHRVAWLVKEALVRQDVLRAALDRVCQRFAADVTMQFDLVLSATVRSGPVSREEG